MTDEIPPHLTDAERGRWWTCTAAETTSDCRRDRVRGELAGCRADLAVESEVADACMAVVEQCRALVEGHACSCWEVTE